MDMCFYIFLVSFYCNLTKDVLNRQTKVLLQSIPPRNFLITIYHCLSVYYVTQNVLFVRSNFKTSLFNLNFPQIPALQYCHKGYTIFSYAFSKL